MEPVEVPFPNPWPIIAMVHLGATPGSPRARLAPAELIAGAVAEARIYLEAGVDALILENMHDAPYLRRPGPEVTATLTAAAVALRAIFPGPIGVQVLAGGHAQALAIALAAGLDFIRVEGFVFAQVSDEGLMEACAGELLRLRRRLAADDIAIFADIKKKHAAHAITADLDLAETARAAAFFGADGLIVTGPATGQPAALDDLQAAQAATSLPLLVGSGVTAEALPELRPRCAGAIVGSALKRDGLWSNPVEARRVEALMRAARALR